LHPLRRMPDGYAFDHGADIAGAEIGSLDFDRERVMNIARRRLKVEVGLAGAGSG